MEPRDRPKFIFSSAHFLSFYKIQNRVFESRTIHLFFVFRDPSLNPGGSAADEEAPFEDFGPVAAEGVWHPVSLDEGDAWEEFGEGSDDTEGGAFPVIA